VSLSTLRPLWHPHPNHDGTTVWRLLSPASRLRLAFCHRQPRQPCGPAASVLWTCGGWGRRSCAFRSARVGATPNYLRTPSALHLGSRFTSAPANTRASLARRRSPRALAGDFCSRTDHPPTRSLPLRTSRRHAASWRPTNGRQASRRHSVAAPFAPPPIPRERRSGSDLAPLPSPGGLRKISGPLFPLLAPPKSSYYAPPTF